MTTLKLYFRSALVLWLLSVLYIWTLVVQTSPISVDDSASLYLSKLIYEQGLIPGPNQDFIAQYTPGYAYMVSAIWSVFGESYTVLLAFIMLGSCISVLCISSSFKHKDQRLILASILLPAMLIYEGGFMSLHAILMPFVCMAYALFRYQKYLWSSLAIGLLLGLALMCKQMAIFLFPAFMLETYWLQRPKPWKHFFLLLVGTCVPFLIYCAFIQENVFLTAYYFMDYGHTGYEQQATDFLFNLSFYMGMPLLSYPIVLSVLWLTFFKFKENRFVLIAFYFPCILLYFQPFHHYLLLLLPWGSICLTRCITLLWKKLHAIKVNKTPALCIAVLLLAFVGYKAKPQITRLQENGRLFRGFYGGLQASSREHQQQRADVIKKWGEQHGAFFVFGDGCAIYLSGVTLPERKTKISFYKYPMNKDGLSRIAEKKYSVALIVRPNNNSVSNMLPFFKEKGYKVIDHIQQDKTHFYLLQKNNSS